MIVGDQVEVRTPENSLFSTHILKGGDNMAIYGIVLLSLFNILVISDGLKKTDLASIIASVVTVLLTLPILYVLLKVVL